MVTPLLWVGEQPGYILEEHEKVIDSVINYYYPFGRDITDVKIPYKYEKLFLDNGAYTALYQGKELDAERVLDLQEGIDPDFTIPLDYPYKPGMERKEMDKRWERTKENILYWQESSSLEIIPSLHAVGTKMMVNSIQWLQKRCNSEFLAVGSVITRYNSRIKINEKFNGYFGDRQPSKQLMDMLLFVGQMTKKYSDFDIHIMGFGSSPLTYHLGVYCGVHSTDSSGHRRKAAFGNIILPGTATRYICNREYNFDNRPPNAEEKELLEECMCPICRELARDSKIRLETLASHWKLRAIHNIWIIKYEEQRAKYLLNEGEDIYEKFLEEMFAKSGLNHLWKYAQKMKKQSRIEYWIGGD